jgi:predicted RNA-binding protein with RPS1 domain
MALVLGITALLILLSGGLVITSAESLPGDSLYPVKLAVEDITVYLVPSSEIKQKYEVNYSQQRVDEVNQLIALKRTQQVSFEGMLEEKSLANWIVSGIPITIQDNTTFVGELKGTESFVTGSMVEVEGITNSQGGVTANEVHLRQYQFNGIVEKIDKNSWQISGTELAITPRTQIEEGIKVGDEVNVVIRSEDNGLSALSIHNAATPVTVQSKEPTESSDPTVVEDLTEHRNIETYEAITTNNVEHTIESNPTSHDEVQATAEPNAGGEPEGSSTVEPTEIHDPENPEAEASASPEMHETPEPTQSPEGTP